MPRKDIEFQTHDNVTLRGWLYTPVSVSEDQKLPVIIMSAVWASLKEMSLDQSAEAFVAKLPIAALVYDHRSWGSSDTPQVNQSMRSFHLFRCPTYKMQSPMRKDSQTSTQPRLPFGEAPIVGVTFCKSQPLTSV
ncbi:hypothetical protein EAF04_001533 [Stromatinia cepivora]|nr:hypothetical protein EAF04_001533 [Stromatinia cepivora]